MASSKPIVNGVLRWRPTRPPDCRPRDYLDLGQREHVGVGALSGQRLGLDDVRHDETSIDKSAVPVPVGPMEVDLGLVGFFENDRSPIEIAPLDEEPAF